MTFITQGKTNWKFLLIVIVLAVIVGGGILAYQSWWLPKEEANNVACTMEAKLCPDGSYVGRTGPNCEFAECPATKTDETADWKTYKNEEDEFEIKYPEDWNFYDEGVVITFCGPEFWQQNGSCRMAGKGTTAAIVLSNNNLDINKEGFCQENPLNIFCGQILSEKDTVIGGKVGEILNINVNNGSLIALWKENYTDEKMYELSADELNNLPEHEDIFNQMLSTFRFLESAVISTQVIKYVPAQLPSEIKEGYCWINSLSARRKDAWRCMVSSMISDPCFIIQGSENLVCNPNPITGDKGFLLKLTKPLPEVTATDNFGKGWGWLIELEDGTVCHFLTGATATVNGERINYDCDVLGDLEVGTVWKAEKAELERVDNEWQAKSIEWVPIRRVWQ
jgi:hypothetical protein